MSRRHFVNPAQVVFTGDVVRTEEARDQAIAAAAAAAASAAEAEADAVATAADRVQTGLDRVATGEDAAATAADRVQTGLDRVATGEDAAATAADRVQTGLDRVATGNDAAATAADRVQTGLDRVATGNDAAATAADRVQTGLDRVATGNDVTQTGNDAVATAADRVAVEAIFEDFDTRYLGDKAAPPTVDNQGNPLVVGALYFRTTAPIGMKVWSVGLTWEPVGAVSIGELTDVDTTTTPPADGDGLVFDLADNEWKPGPAGGGMFRGNNGTVGSRVGDIIRVNAQTLTVNTTIAGTENASASGPLAIDPGVTLTVAAGGTLVIL